MKKTFFKIAGCTLASALLFMAFEMATMAEQKADSTTSSAMTTNWVGYFVFGERDTTDSITTEPFPKTDSRVQIGLRSDGIVVWRKANP